MNRALLVLGGGFVGRAVARQRRARLTTRSPEHARALERDGFEPLLLPALTPEAIAPHLGDADVVVTFPPDGATDARLAPALRGRKIAYVSSTGVYGGLTGRVDEEAPVDPHSPRSGPRLEAERAWAGAGAAVLRAAGIYGPDRGLHLRLARGEHRLPGDGSNVVSRLHVDDLAALLLAALDRAPPGRIYNAADDAPVPQLEVIRWLCERMGLPLPASVPLESVDASLRGDRAIDGGRIQRELGVALRFPTYREGFADCLARAPSLHARAPAG